MSTVRVRFAPSPTGKLHLGNARTAIVNWLCARHYGGAFILRIEDTDAERSSRESEEGIIKQLSWLGLDWDEGPVKGGSYGPYRQSERTAIYREAVDKLLSAGSAYLCYCSKEELEAERQRALREKRSPGYSGKCGNLTPEDREHFRRQGRKPVVRFRVPKGRVSFNDLVQGEIAVDAGTLTDFIIQREDGTSPYNFSVVVDDAAMKISHVIRGNDHVSNTPRQVLIYKALGYDQPAFAHIPMITGADGARLSKRHGHTSVGEFRRAGYLPQALINYLSLLSWSSETGDEVLSVRRLIDEFDFTRISRSPAAFDTAKLNWLNGVYIRSVDTGELVTLAKPYLERAGMCEQDEEKLKMMVDAVRERVETLADIPVHLQPFFQDAPVFAGEEERAVVESTASQTVYCKLLELLSGRDSVNVDDFQDAMKSIQKETGIKGKNLWMPVRVALTGQMHGPELVRILEILGPEKYLSFIRAAVR